MALPPEEDDIRTALQLTFYNAALAFARKIVKDPEGWREIGEITDQVAKKLETLDKNYKDTYDQRVTRTRQQLMSDAARPQMQHPAPLGARSKGADALNIEAHRAVQRAHSDEVLRATLDGQKSVEDLLERVWSQTETVGPVRDAFHKAVDSGNPDQMSGPKRSQD